MSALNRRIITINPSSRKSETGIVVSESVIRKMYKVKFDSGVYWVDKSTVQFLPA